MVKARVEEGRIILERDPLEDLTASVIEGTKDVEREIAKLREAAEREALRRVGGHWLL